MVLVCSNIFLDVSGKKGSNSPAISLRANNRLNMQTRYFYIHTRLILSCSNRAEAGNICVGLHSALTHEFYNLREHNSYYIQDNHPMHPIRQLLNEITIPILTILLK